MGDVIPNEHAFMSTHFLVATQYAHYRAPGTYYEKTNLRF